LANASAQEVLIKAVAESQAKIVVAQGTRQAIENIMRSAGVTNSTRIAELYLWVEAMKQLNIGTFIIVTGQNGVPLIYQLPSNSTAP
jgi:regulator of protease activity HflC (stomatin/prohibitin superfamily)